LLSDDKRHLSVFVGGVYHLVQVFSDCLMMPAINDTFVFISRSVSAAEIDDGIDVNFSKGPNSENDAFRAAGF
jgi:hypothetical protein